MIKQKIEQQFASLSLKIIKHRFSVLFVVLLITVALASQITRLTIDTSNFPGMARFSRNAIPKTAESNHVLWAWLVILALSRKEYCCE